MTFLISFDLLRNHFIWHDALRHGMMPCRQFAGNLNLESKITLTSFSNLAQ